MTVQRHLTLHPDCSALLLGPRGTGKTTFLKTQFPHSLRFDLLDGATYQALLANPSRLAARIPQDYQGTVIIDEVQKVPALLNEVHRLIEEKSLRFILTGSSARSLRKKGVNLLAGRALSYTMHPLTAHECAPSFDLKRALNHGQLPATLKHAHPEHYLKSYVHTYLKEEVQQEGLTRNLDSFSRFLEVASFSQGETLNLTNIAQEVGTSRHTIANYFDILDDLLLARRLPVFSRRAKRTLVTKPKFYFFDVGVYRHLRPRGPLDSTEELEGPCLETLFLQEVLARNAYEALDYRISYWRTQSGHEVDFILYGPRGFHAIEIKRKSTLTPKDFNGLKRFLNDYPEATGHLWYTGIQAYHHDGIWVHPYAQSLPQLVETLEQAAP